MPAYLACEWTHQLQDEPRFLYSELGDERHETRRVEVFEDGRIVRVEDKGELSDQAAPSVEEIKADPGGELRAWEIGVVEFEELWHSADQAG